MKIKNSFISHEEKIEKIIERMKNPDLYNVDVDTAHKENKIIKITTGFLSVFLVFVIVIVSIFSHFLGKMNYGDVAAVAENNSEAISQLDEEENIDFDIVESIQITEAKTTQNAIKSKLSSEISTTKHTTVVAKINKSIEEKENIASSNIGKEIQKKANSDIEKNISDDVLWYSDEVYNILVAGYDAGGNNGESGNFHRSDAIIIASINKTKKALRLISLSRATYAAIPGHGNKRLNTAHAYGGASLLTETIETNYKVKIDKYVTADFNGFKNIIDSMGGISLELTEVEADFVFDDDTLPAGTYAMDGRQALKYVRLRKTDSDRTRTGRQRKLLNEILVRVNKMTVNQQIEFLETVLPYITTNFTKSEIMSKAADFSNYLSYPISQYIVPKKANQYEMRDGLEVIIVDWADTTSYIHSIMYDDVKVVTA